MPVVASRPTIDVSGHTLRVADVARLPNDLPSGPVLYELDNGHLVVTSTPTVQRGTIDFRMMVPLVMDGEQQGHGKAITGDVHCILWRDPDRLVVVDAAFVGRDKLPLRRTRSGFLETIPDLVVEVTSSHDSEGYLHRKVTDLQQAGVRVILQIDVEERLLIEHRTDQAPRTYSGADELMVPDVIPDFTLAVADLFSEAF